MNVTIDSESLAALLALEGECNSLLDQKFNLEAELRDFKAGKMTVEDSLFRAEDKVRLLSQENESLRKGMIPLPARPLPYEKPATLTAEKIENFRLLMGFLKGTVGCSSNKIDAIKAMRRIFDAEQASSSLGLKEAKDLVEEFHQKF